jgi:hypothetical protein
MSDYERYGDYNEIDEDPSKKAKIILRILKIATLLVCAAVVGFLGFRLIVFNTYPEEITKLYFDEALSAYYDETNGDIGAKTQGLRFPYDDENLGNFFCDYMVIIDGVDQLQVTLRYNKSTVGRINKAISAENLKREEINLEPLPLLSDTADNLFTFRLTDGKGLYFEGKSVKHTSKLMYRYDRLVFEGVDLPLPDGSYPEGLMVEISLNVPELEGVHFITLKDSPNGDVFADGVFQILVYENNEKYNSFKDYKLSDGEAPEK